LRKKPGKTFSQSRSEHPSGEAFGIVKKRNANKHRLTGEEKVTEERGRYQPDLFLLQGEREKE